MTKQSNFTNGDASNLNGVETFFMNLVKDGKLQQMPANYDCATLKMYISHLENENAKLRKNVELHKGKADDNKTWANYEHATQMEWFDNACKTNTENKRLTAENAELKARLEKSVELEAKIGDILYMPWVYDGNAAVATLLIINIHFINNEFVYITNLRSDSAVYLAKYKYGIFRSEDFDNIIFTDRTKAEQRLAELKGGKQ